MTDKESSWSNIRNFAAYYRPHMRLAGADLTAIIAQALLTVLIPMIVYRIFNRFLTEGDWGKIISSALVLLMLAVLIAGAEYVSLRWGHILGARMEADMRNDLFRHIQKLSFSFFDRTKTGHLMSRISNDLTQLAETAHHAPEDLLVSVLTMTGAFVVMFSMNPLLAGITLIPLPFILVWGSIFQSRMRSGFRDVREKIADINRGVENSIQGIREVKSFSNESLEMERFHGINRGFLSAKERVYRTLATFHAGVTFLIQSYSLLFIGAGAVLAAMKLADFPQILAFFMYSRYITMPIIRMVNFTEQFQQASAAFERFREVMREQPELDDRPDAVSFQGKVRGEIEFRQVFFRYSAQKEDWVLNNLSFRIPAGQSVALVGESGAGKTTVASLIPRFYDVVQGAVLLDGTDVRDCRQAELHRNIGIVQQMPFLFDASIRDNILFGKPDASDDELRDAAREANILSFIESLPDGFDTPCGERGIKLSGGQRQRISIARVFLKNPPVLIFDEATSALDNESEEQVRLAMEKLCRNRTSILIAHRLSTIKNAQYIYCLKGGILLEHGTHAELIRKNGYYHRLYEMHTF